MADLNNWHHAIHQVTGDMALRFNKATVADNGYRCSNAYPQHRMYADHVTELEMAGL